MIKTCQMTEADLFRLKELKKTTEAATDSQVIREAVREYHKKIFGIKLPIGSKSKIKKESQKIGTKA